MRNTEIEAIYRVGLRSSWLHLQLTGVSGNLLNSREQQLLTLVATVPHGMPRRMLTERVRAVFGTDRATTERRVVTLEREGYLSQSVRAGEVVVDLPASDLPWIQDHLDALLAQGPLTAAPEPA